MLRLLGITAVVALFASATPVAEAQRFSLFRGHARQHVWHTPYCAQPALTTPVPAQPGYQGFSYDPEAGPVAVPQVMQPGYQPPVAAPRTPSFYRANHKFR